MTLCCCCLQVENRDRLVIVIKNLLDDARTDCKPQDGFKDFLIAEARIAKENYEFIEQAGFFEELVADLQNTVLG